MATKNKNWHRYETSAFSDIFRLYHPVGNIEKLSILTSQKASAVGQEIFSFCEAESWNNIQVDSSKAFTFGRCKIFVMS